MNPTKMHWVMDVLLGEARQILRREHQNPHEGMINAELWDRAREDVKHQAARILAALQKPDFFTYEDYLAYKGKQKG